MIGLQENRSARCIVRPFPPPTPRSGGKPVLSNVCGQEEDFMTEEMSLPPPVLAACQRAKSDEAMVLRFE